MKAHEYAFCPECGNKLEGDEFLCPSCGFKLAERPPVTPPPAPPVAPPKVEQQVPPVVPPPPPVSQPTPPPPPVNQQAPPVVPPPPVSQQTPPVMQTPPPPVNQQVPPVMPPPTPQPQPKSQPITYQPAPQQQYVPQKKKSATWLIILLIVLGVIIVGGGVGAFLIYNGTIPKDKVTFIPQNVLEMLTPVSKKSETSTVVAPKQTFYVTYSYGLVNNKKVVIISSVMDPAVSDKSNKAGAETAFLEFARINYSKDYFLLTKNITTKTFNDRKKALDERDNIKKDFEKKGYELRLMEVQYSVN